VGVHGDFCDERARGILKSALDMRDSGLSHTNLSSEFGLRQPTQLTGLSDSPAAKHQLFLVPVAFSSLRLIGRSAGAAAATALRPEASAGSGMLTHQCASAYFWPKALRRIMRRMGVYCDGRMRRISVDHDLHTQLRGVAAL
jgi:hypothetical protein